MIKPDPKIGQRAMVLAAGLGTRMRPLTDVTPKPLIKVAGKPIIEYGFDRLREIALSVAVVNAHYLPDQIINWCQSFDNPKTIISDESHTIQKQSLLSTKNGALPKCFKALAMPPPVSRIVCDSSEMIVFGLSKLWHQLMI